MTFGFRYQAPEVLSSKCNGSEASDVYAWAMCAAQVITDSKRFMIVFGYCLRLLVEPYVRCIDSLEVQRYRDDNGTDDPLGLGPLGKGDPYDAFLECTALKEFLESCCQRDPLTRPTIENVIATLENLVPSLEPEPTTLSRRLLELVLE